MSLYTYTFFNQTTTPGGVVGITEKITGDANLEQMITVAPGATAQTGPLSVVQANMVALAIIFTATGSVNGSVGGHCTLTTTGTVDTIQVYDGVPIQYYANNGVTNPFTGNITGYSLADHSTGSVGGTLQISVLTNQ